MMDQYDLVHKKEEVRMYSDRIDNKLGVSIKTISRLKLSGPMQQKTST